MDVVSLNSINVGQKGVIKSIAGGRTASKRLYEMGFNRGNEVSVVKNDLGPIIVDLGGSKIAIGRGLAHKILLELTNSNS